MHGAIAESTQRKSLKLEQSDTLRSLQLCGEFTSSGNYN
jgi:hypothetical protein